MRRLLQCEFIWISRRNISDGKELFRINVFGFNEIHLRTLQKFRPCLLVTKFLLTCWLADWRWLSNGLSSVVLSVIIYDHHLWPPCIINYNFFHVLDYMFVWTMWPVWWATAMGWVVFFYSFKGYRFVLVRHRVTIYITTALLDYYHNKVSTCLSYEIQQHTLGSLFIDWLEPCHLFGTVIISHVNLDLLPAPL